jgi:alginate O-acetyltransferase complex protein AlgF
MNTDRNVTGRPERPARDYRAIRFAPAYVYVPAKSVRKVPARARERREHFCQLRPGTKRVLQWRAYLAGVMLLAGSLGAPGASADDEALYGPAAPPGSAFVRVFNPGSQDIDASVADKAMRGIEPYAVSEFVFLPPGQHKLTAGGASQTVALKGGRYYTAVPAGKGFRLFDNDGKLSRLKALVIVYNLTGAPVSLQTAQGTAVIENVAPEASGARAVNAVKTGLALSSAGTRVADVKPITFERGKAFSLFVLPGGEQPMSVWAVN